MKIETNITTVKGVMTMKLNKLLSLLLATILCSACILGCEQIEPAPDAVNETTASDGTDGSYTPNKVHTSGETDTSDKLENPDVDIPLLTIVSYSDYASFLESTDLPDEFVDYDSISLLGEFDRFICLSDARYDDYSSYLYVLNDENYEGLGLYIDHEIEPFENSNVDVNSEDMRRIDASESGTYLLSGLEYTYVSGLLLSVSWQIDGVTYTLAGNSMLYDYPLDIATQVGKLLNVDSANAVVDSLTSLSTQ